MLRLGDHLQDAWEGQRSVGASRNCPDCGCPKNDVITPKLEHDFSSPAVLVPGLDLRVGQAHPMGQVHAVLHRQVLVLLEHALQLLQLLVREDGPGLARLLGRGPTSAPAAASRRGGGRTTAPPVGRARPAQARRSAALRRLVLQRVCKIMCDCDLIWFDWVNVL